MSDRLVRLAPLTGVVFAALSAVTFVITPTSPSAHASGAKVISFYEAHRSSERVSVIVGVLALAFFMHPEIGRGPAGERAHASSIGRGRVGAETRS
jgi:hypothetical protein